MRLFSRFALHEQGDNRVAEVKVRIATPVPAGARVILTDLQLQPGTNITGWTLHPSDLGVQPVDGWSWRNGILSGDQHPVITADMDSASPTRWDIRRAANDVRLGQYHMGAASGAERLDGWAHTATTGAGIPPHVTERSDITLDTRVTGRTLACLWLRGLYSPGDDLITPVIDLTDGGPVTGTHGSWGQALAHHDTWPDVLATHTDWS